MHPSDTTKLLSIQQGVIESLENSPITFLRDQFFGQTEEFETQEVHFDVLDKKRRIAPFVSPLVPGKVVEKRGHETKYFRPAYVKPKTPIDPSELQKRLPGEPLMGSLSPEQRRDGHVAMILRDHVEMLNMREEVMASEILRTGKLTIEGEGFGQVVMDFGRHADLTVNLTSTARWGESAADPVADLTLWGRKIRQHSNAVARVAVMEDEAFDRLLVSLTAEQKTELFDSRRASESRVELGPRLAEKLRYEGRLGQVDIWTYTDTYSDEDGNELDVMPANTVIMCSTALEGVSAYGAILDARQLRARRIWPKVWEEQDPSREWVMSQSAPVLVPLRVNACLGATVHS